MVDGSGSMDFSPTASASAAGGVMENVAELQFGPDFDDIHGT